MSSGLTAAGRDRRADWLQACTMAGHFLDELLPVSQTVVVRQSRSISSLLSFPGMRQLFTLTLLPWPGPLSRTSRRTLGRYVAVIFFLPGCVKSSSWEVPPADRLLCCLRWRYRWPCPPAHAALVPTRVDGATVAAYRRGCRRSALDISSAPQAFSSAVRELNDRVHTESNQDHARTSCERGLTLRKQQVILTPGSWTHASCTAPRQPWNGVLVPGRIPQCSRA